MTQDKKFDITTAPLTELLNDLSESRTDVDWCKIALDMGIGRYGGPNHDQKDVQERLDSNREMIKIIAAELTRRGFKKFAGELDSEVVE